MNRIKSMQSNIVFLQETHLMHKDDLKVRRRLRGNVFSASFNSQARGVITLVHKSIPLQVNKVIKDKFGRYLIIQGNLLKEQIVLANIYAPNTDDPNLFQNLFLTLSTLPGNCIVAGDFNCTLDPVRDRSTGTDQSHPRSRSIIHHFMKEMNLIDIWREVNPNVLKFSCYSSVHKSYSRIDFFLLSAELRHRIKECTYDAILISDHAPNSLIYQDSKLVRDASTWRCKQKWLADPGFVAFLDQQIKFYFEINTTETSASIRWEAFKAFIRGQIISIISSKAKQTFQKAKNLETRIKVLENEYYRSRSPESHQNLLLLRAQYNKLSASKATASLLRLKQTFYDQGEKPGKVLASSSYRVKDLSPHCRMIKEKPL